MLMYFIFDSGIIEEKRTVVGVTYRSWCDHGFLFVTSCAPMEDKDFCVTKSFISCCKDSFWLHCNLLTLL